MRTEQGTTAASRSSAVPSAKARNLLPDIEPPTERIAGVAHHGTDDSALIRDTDLVVAHIVEYQWTDKGKGQVSST